MAYVLPSYIPRKFRRIHLELTNRCNFSCVFCPDGKMTRPRGLMDETLARSAMDQIAKLDLAEKITFHVMGEPLLYPQLMAILDHAASLNLPVGLTTNGLLLRPDIIRQLAQRDLRQIDISLQTPDKESFLATRGARADFDEYCNRILDLIAACSARPSPPIFKIRIMTTRFAGKMMKQLGIPDFMGNSDHLRSTVLHWTERVTDRLGRAVPNWEDVKRRIRKIGIRSWNVIEISPNIYIETYVLTDWGNTFADEGVIEARHGYCFGMKDHFAILCSGDVVLCCVDFDGKTSLGNLKDASLLEILSSDRLEKIMNGFKRGRLEEPYCKHCLGTHSVLGSWIKPAASVLGLKLLKPFFYRKYRLFD